MEVEVTKTKEDDLKSGSVVRCLLYDARVRTTHDKNAEVPNMGLSLMACAQTGSADKNPRTQTLKKKPLRTITDTQSITCFFSCDL